MVAIHQITCDNMSLINGLLTMFGEAFEDIPTYTGNKPRPEYFQRLCHPVN